MSMKCTGIIRGIIIDLMLDIRISPALIWFDSIWNDLRPYHTTIYSEKCTVYVNSHNQVIFVYNERDDFGCNRDDFWMVLQNFICKDDEAYYETQHLCSILITNKLSNRLTILPSSFFYMHDKYLARASMACGIGTPGPIFK